MRLRKRAPSVRVEVNVQADTDDDREREAELREIEDAKRRRDLIAARLVAMGVKTDVIVRRASG